MEKEWEIQRWECKEGNTKRGYTDQKINGVFAGLGETKDNTLISSTATV